MRFDRNVLKIDCEKETRRIEEFIKEQVHSKFNKKGAVVGLSGGVDSSVTAALCVRSLGHDKVLGIILPEKESNPISEECAKVLANKLRIKTIKRDITSILEAFGVYSVREKIVEENISHFKPGYPFRLVMPGNILKSKQLNVPCLEVKDKKGCITSELLSADDYLTMVAATNIKQRARMALLYYYAEKGNYLVAGTTNMTEYLLGFFVKYGDGGVDIEPIRHLYKMQVYQLADYLGMPKAIIARDPTPDTFSFPISDEKLYFRLPYRMLDLLLYAWHEKIPLSKVEKALDLDLEQVKRVFRDFQVKDSIAKYLRNNPAEILVH